MIITDPMEIEKKSFEIITAEMAGSTVLPENELVLKRVIHTSADFDYIENLKFSDNAVNVAIAAMKSQCVIVTDTQMVKSGINKVAAEIGVEVHCFMSDDDVAAEAKQRGVTRAIVSMEKAARLKKPCIMAIGNAPTALLCLYDMIVEKKFTPVLIIGAPVGFVNVVESKEQIMKAGIPYIVAAGRKGGSPIAAAICNALLYQIKR